MKQKNKIESRIFTTETLKTSLDSLTNAQVANLLHDLLQEFDADDLREMIELLVSDSPKQTILKMANVSNFKISKFGVLPKAGLWIEENTTSTTNKKTEKK